MFTNLLENPWLKESMQQRDANRTLLTERGAWLKNTRRCLAVPKNTTVGTKNGTEKTKIMAA